MKEDENNAEDQTVLRKRDVNEPARKEDGGSGERKGERSGYQSDVALLGPQVGYQLAKSKEICGAAGVPVDVIPMADYGMCNGMNVLRFAFKLAAGKE